MLRQIDSDLETFGMGRYRKRTGWYACGTPLVVLLLAMCKLAYNSISPPIVIPAKSLPAVNAFDDFARAYTRVVTTKAFDPSLVDDSLYEVPRPTLEKYVTQNQGAITAARAGLHHDYMDPSARSVLAQYPYFANDRALARIFVVEAVVKANHSAYGAAVDSNLDAVQLGSMLPHGATVIGELVSIACQSMGRQHIWKDLGSLNAVEAKSAAHRMANICKNEVDLKDIVLEEKYCGLSALQLLFKGGNNLSQLFSGGGKDLVSSPSGAGIAFYFLAHSKGSILSDYVSYMDHLSGLVDRSYQETRNDNTESSDPFVAMIVPNFMVTRIKVFENRAQNGLLELSLALRAYRLDKGAYPDTLASLTPGYLPSLPIDPYTAGEGFRYHNEGAKYLLYSVGPDGRDDGGIAISDPQKGTKTKPQARYIVEPDSKGDIVAGINTR